MNRPDPDQKLRLAWQDLGLHRYWFLQRLHLNHLLSELPVKQDDAETLPPEEVQEARIGFFRRLVALLTRRPIESDEPAPARYSSTAQTVIRSYRRFQRRLLRQYRAYYRLLRRLPADEIDRQIGKLEQQFGYVGRSAEWFSAFDELVSEVLRVARASGQNEPQLRVLQNDFLLEMERQFGLFYRYYELRTDCFESGERELINAFSYFEQNAGRDQRAGKAADPDQIQRFIVGMEHKRALVRRETPAAQTRREQLMEIDHQERVNDWAQVRERLHAGLGDVEEQLATLRAVLVQVPEWRQEFSVFRSAMQVQRLMDPDFASSGLEEDEMRDFIARMSDRVDEELPTDVMYKTIEQELLTSGEHADSLQLVRQQIAHELRQRGADAPERILATKRRFIEQILATRDTPSHQLTSLFSRMGPRGKWTGDRDSGSR